MEPRRGCHRRRSARRMAWSATRTRATATRARAMHSCRRRRRRLRRLFARAQHRPGGRPAGPRARRRTAAAPPAARHGAPRHPGALSRRGAARVSPRADLQARRARGGGRALHDGPPLLVRARGAPQRRSAAPMRTRAAAATASLRLGIVGQAFRFGCHPQLASAGGCGWRAGGATCRHGIDTAPCQPAALGPARHRGLMKSCCSSCVDLPKFED